MTAPSFEDYSREYTAQGIGELWYGLITGMVKQIVIRYPPDIYSPNRIWDNDAILAVCHDYTIERLLGSRRLEYFLSSQESVTGLRRSLMHDFRQFLANRKVRSEYTNLYERLKKGLEEDARFTKHSLSRNPQTFWGLADSEQKRIAQDRNQVLEAMFTVPLPPLVRYRPDSKKISPLLSNRNLLQFVADCLQRLNANVSFHLLMESLRYRLDLLDDDVVSLDQPIHDGDDAQLMSVGDTISDPIDGYQHLTNEELATELYERLSDRQRDILALNSILENPTLEEIAKHMGISKSTVDNERAAIGQIIESQLLNQAVDPIFAALTRKCVDGFEQDRNG